MIARRHVVLAAPIALAWSTLGCSSDDDDEDDDEVAPEVADVVFLGGTSDEALLKLIATPATDVADFRVVIDTPGDADVLPAATAATFAWHYASVTAALPSGRHPKAPAGWRRFARDLEKFLSPVSVAYAHGTPFNGTGYFLVFSTADNDQLLRVFTSLESYTPDETAWATLSAAGANITLTITSAQFENNLLVEDGGPFVGGSVGFSIE